MNNATVFIGRFHPLLVHLPIGILLLAVVFQFLSFKTRFAFLRPALPLTWLAGALGAVLSCISGYLLSGTGGYDEATLFFHQWLGIATAVGAFGGYLLSRRKSAQKWQLVASALIFLLLTGAGHYGGSLTHGADYLTASAGADDEKKKMVITDIREAQVYTAVIEPILQLKCAGCHNAGKQKGGLQLQTPELLMKGGEGGPSLVPGDPEKSELVKRIQLPLNDEEHMAPKGKPQVTEAELKLISWWIREGASFSAKVKELKADEKETALLLALQQNEGKEEEAKNYPDKDVPAEPVEPASDKSMHALKATGALLIPVSASTNYLSLGCLNAPAFGDEQMKLLAPLEKQLVFVSFKGTKISDAGLKNIKAMPNLVKLGLEQTNITDEGLKELNKFPSLKYINLQGTKVSAKGLLALKGMKTLKRITVFQTNISSADSLFLEKELPNVEVEIGGYTLPSLATDTQRLSAPYKKE